MKLFISIIAFCAVLNTQVKAQFKYDSEKVSAIRGTPMPATVGNLKEFKIDLNGSWYFNPAPERDFLLESKQSDWKTIEVPGEWAMQGHTIKSGEYAGYVRSFNIPSAWKWNRVILKCEAIYSECKIYINSKKAGGHLSGMTAFEKDITSLVKNIENHISIAVLSESLADTLSSTSRYAVHQLGGITRPIYLIAVPEVKCTCWFLNTTTPDLNVSCATAILSNSTSHSNIDKL